MTTVMLTLDIIAVAAILFVYLGSTWFITPVRRGLEPRHRELLSNPADHGLALQPIRVRTNDNFFLESILATRSAEPGRAEKTLRMEKRLAGKGITDHPEPRGTIFLLHGRGGRKEDMLSVAQRFVAADYRCIVHDARAHGKSEGDFCTFGIHEVGDLTTLINFYDQHLKSEGYELGSIGVFGLSLGDSIVLQALNNEDRIEAAVAVAPFAELPEIVISSGRRKLHPAIPEWLIHLSMRVGGACADFDPYSISPLHEATGTTTPLFMAHGTWHMAHGTLDEIIPIDHSKRLFDASDATNKTWHEVHSGYHHNVLAEGGDELYEEMIHSYLKHAG